jgi:hypothetical protein
MVLPFLLLGIIVIVLIVTNQNANERKQLWSAYQKTLGAGDKAAALRAGRAYYSKLRKGIPTAADELALNNDLSTMK